MEYPHKDHGAKVRDCFWFKMNAYVYTHYMYLECLQSKLFRVRVRVRIDHVASV